MREKTIVGQFQRPLFPGTATTGFDSLTVLHDQLRRNIGVLYKQERAISRVTG